MPTRKATPKKSTKKTNSRKPAAKPKKVAFGFGANEKKTKRAGKA